MLTDVAIIGGTGVGEVLARLDGKVLHVPTPEGQLTGRLVDHVSGAVLLVSRHSGGHKVPPHKVNYKAIALGLKKIGVKFCFSTAAVGSLREDWPPGTMIAVSDFSDFTGRSLTMFDSTVTHTDFGHPFSVAGRRALIDAGAELGCRVHPNGVYVCENGPRYETPHEVVQLTNVGDIVGMTAATEAILLREAGVEYSCLAFVTNLAAGIGDTPLCHEEVVAEMSKSAETVVKILLEAVDRVRTAI